METHIEKTTLNGNSRGVRGLRGEKEYVLSKDLKAFVQRQHPVETSKKQGFVDKIREIILHKVKLV